MTPKEIAHLLNPYVPEPASFSVEWPHVCDQLTLYLDLILKWNARTNLTAIRDPEEIVRRHFGESLFAAQHLGPCKTLLDFGSGAGFPGIPIQLLHPKLHVTLAESQNKKASFLHEVCRQLKLPTQIFADRVESMPPNRKFDIVILRAVDKMDLALAEAATRATRRVAALVTQNEPKSNLTGFTLVESRRLPESEHGHFSIFAPADAV